MYELGGTSPTWESHLFIPEEDPLETLWSPAPPNLDEARALYDTTRICFTKDFQANLKSIIESKPNHVLHLLPESPLFPAPPKELPFKVSEDHTRYLLPALHEARLIKDAYEIALIKKANDISSRAHEVVMRLLGQGVLDQSSGNTKSKESAPLLPSQWRISKEAEAEAVFVASCRREGCV